MGLRLDAGALASGLPLGIAPGGLVGGERGGLPLGSCAR